MSEGNRLHSGDAANVIADHTVAKLASDLGIGLDQFYAALRWAVSEASNDQPDAEDDSRGRSMSVREIAERISIDHQAVRRSINRGELSAYKLCGRLRVYESDFEAWHEDCRLSKARPGVQATTTLFPVNRPAPTQGLRQLLERREKAA
jgi:excisionase family DNA binding protein